MISKIFKIKYGYYVIGLMALLLSTSILAQAGSSGGSIFEHFKIADHDISQYLIQQIFGYMPPLFGRASEAGIFNAMFRVFNQAMLLLVVLIIIWTGFLSLVEMSRGGEAFIGKKVTTIWSAVRDSASFVFLMPQASGYSFIQTLLMWIALEGIAAADLLWDTVTAYIYGVAGPGSTAGSTVPGNLLTPSIIEGTGLISGKDFVRYYLCSLRSSGHGYKPTLDSSSSSDNAVLTFADLAICGFAWITSAAQPDASASYDVQLTYHKLQGVQNGIQAVLADDSLVKNPLLTYLDLIDASGSDINKVIAALFQQRAAGTWQNPISGYQKKMSDTVLSSVQGIQIPSGETLQKAAADVGWAVAGAYYYTLARLTSLTGDATQYDSAFTYDGLLSDLTDDDNQLITALFQDASGALASIPIPTEPTPGYMGVVRSVAEKVMKPFYSMLFNAPMGDVDPNNPGLVGLLSNPGVDPMVKLQSFGVMLISLCEMIFSITMYTLLTIALIVAVCSGMASLWQMFQVSMAALVPLGAVLGALFSVGLTFCVYIPIIPYIIFIFGVFGWLVAVIESMIAAPLVAMGVAIPGENELIGRASPAIQIVMNIFMRPTLMIFGLISAMVLARVALTYVNLLFGMAVLSIQSGNWNLQMSTDSTTSAAVWWSIHFEGGFGIGALSVIRAFLFLCIYCAVVVQIVHRSFSLIHKFPDQILRWISWQGQLGEFAEAGERAISEKLGTAVGITRGVIGGMGEGAMKGGGEAKLPEEPEKSKEAKESGQTGPAAETNKPPEEGKGGTGEVVAQPQGKEGGGVMKQSSSQAGSQASSAKPPTGGTPAAAGGGK